MSRSVLRKALRVVEERVGVLCATAAMPRGVGLGVAVDDRANEDLDSSYRSPRDRSRGMLAWRSSAL
jgi:hypothetical protein